MYINNVHILYYLGALIVGLFVGELVNWCNYRLPEYKKIFSKDIIEEYKNGKVKPNIILMVVTAIIYMLLIYATGVSHQGIIQNITLIKYLVLTPMLLSAFVIDYKLQIIPNRLNLTIFELGLVFTFIEGLTNINAAINMLLGMLAGGGIFLIITLIGGLIAGKEAMGFGDVKFMGALGLFFGLPNIIMITVVSFLISAIISIILIVTKIRKADEYIPFGPFIVIACFIVMLIPFSSVLFVLLKIFTLGMIK